jgi:hypothetical protein
MSFFCFKYNKLMQAIYYTSLFNYLNRIVQFRYYTYMYQEFQQNTSVCKHEM